MKLTLAQQNPIVGDLEGNLIKVAATLAQTEKDTPDLVVFPELFVVGYPPRDLLEKSWFVKRIEKTLEEIKALSKKYFNTGIILGVPLSNEIDGSRRLYNAAVLIYQGELIFSQGKSLLPTYDVFDEARYFEAATGSSTVPFKNEILGITV